MTRASNDPWLRCLFILKELSDLETRLETVEHGHLKVRYNEAVLLVIDLVQLLHHVYSVKTIGCLVHYLVKEVWRLTKLLHGCLKNDHHALQVEGLIIHDHNTPAEGVQASAAVDCELSQ